MNDAFLVAVTYSRTDLETKLQSQVLIESVLLLAFYELFQFATTAILHNYANMRISQKRIVDFHYIIVCKALQNCNFFKHSVNSFGRIYIVNFYKLNRHKLL